MWRPHFAFPLAASYIVIPFEQEVNIIAIKIINTDKVDFFMSLWVLD